MPDIVISEFMDQKSIDDLSCEFDVHYDPDLVDNRPELINIMNSAKAIIVRNRTQVSLDLLEKSEALKVVGRLGVGLDNIDLKACSERAIKVCPATGANDLAVAEYVIANALLLMRQAYLSTDAMLEGSWPRQSLIGKELSGKKMGLVGIGNIAREVAKRADTLGMSILAFDPYTTIPEPLNSIVKSCASLDELLSEADVVSLHVPLNKNTKFLINANALDTMKKSSVLINTSRGGVVDEESLARALQNNAIAGAALDVFEEEPLSKEQADKFRGLINLILTPHIAGVTEESNKRVSQVTAENVRLALNGAA